MEPDLVIVNLMGWETENNRNGQISTNNKIHQNKQFDTYISGMEKTREFSFSVWFRIFVVVGWSFCNPISSTVTVYFGCPLSELVVSGIGPIRTHEFDIVVVIWPSLDIKFPNLRNFVVFVLFCCIIWTNTHKSLSHLLDTRFIAYQQFSLELNEH